MKKNKYKFSILVFLALCAVCLYILIDINILLIWVKYVVLAVMYGTDENKPSFFSNN